MLRKSRPPQILRTTNVASLFIAMADRKRGLRPAFFFWQLGLLRQPSFGRKTGYGEDRAIGRIAICVGALGTRGSVKRAVGGLDHASHGGGAIRSAERQLVHRNAAGAYRKDLPKIIRICVGVKDGGSPQVAVRRLQ